MTQTRMSAAQPPGIKPQAHLSSDSESALRRRDCSPCAEPRYVQRGLAGVPAHSQDFRIRADF